MRNSVDCAPFLWLSELETIYVIPEKDLYGGFWHILDYFFISADTENRLIEDLSDLGIREVLIYKDRHLAEILSKDPPTLPLKAYRQVECPFYFRYQKET